MNITKQLSDIHQSGKPYIIYKSQKGFDLYTDFSKKIILNNKNIKSFLSIKNKKKLKKVKLIKLRFVPNIRPNQKLIP